MLVLPEDFKDQMKSMLGSDFNSFEHSLTKAAPTSIRLNLNKTNPEDYKSLSSVDWCPHGFYLDERPKFSLDPSFHTGSYYVQEASSMILDHILHQLDIPNQALAIDLCAAPGGKSTILADHMHKINGTLIANEVIRSRTKVLHENLVKWGYSHQIVTNSDSKYFTKTGVKADVVLLDAPCSGEGLFRKDSKAISHWSLDHVKHCSLRQQRIIKDGLALLKDGGYLIYSTCTYNEYENDKQISACCLESDVELVDLKTPVDWNVKKTEGGLRLFPHFIKGEGLFISVLQKTRQNTNQKSQRTNTSTRHKISKKEWATLESWVNHLNHNNIYKYQDQMIHYTGKISIEKLKGIRIYSYGRIIGRPVSNGFRPNPQWALSVNISDSLHKVELNEEMALNAIQHAIIPAVEKSSSWLLLTYKSNGLYFAKEHKANYKIQYPKF